MLQKLNDVNPLKIPGGLKRLWQIRKSRADLGELSETSEIDKITLIKLKDESSYQIRSTLTRTLMLAGLVGLGISIYGRITEKNMVPQRRVTSVPSPTDGGQTLTGDEVNQRILNSHDSLNVTQGFCLNLLNTLVLKLEKEPESDASGAKTLLAHYKKHAKPPSNAPVLKGNFTYDLLTKKAENPKHAWFQKHDIVFYDPAIKKLFIDAPHAPLDSTFKENAEFAFQIALSIFDLWLALYDANTHDAKGQIQFENNPIAKLITQTAAQSFFVATQNIVDKIDFDPGLLPEVCLQKTLDILDVVIENYITAQPVSTYKPIRERMKKAMAYRIVRFALAQNDQGIEPIKPALLRIAQDPTMLDR